MIDNYGYTLENISNGPHWPVPQESLHLPDDTIDVWAIAPIAPDLAWNHLSVAEQQRANHIAHPLRHAQYVIGHAALHALSNRYATAITPQQCSLTHTAGLILAAVAQAPMGIDAEYIDRRRAPIPLIRRCCSMEEQIEWATLPQEYQLNAFYRLWCAKEALYKSIYPIGEADRQPLAARVFPDLVCSSAVIPPPNAEPAWIDADLHDNRMICLFVPTPTHQAACATTTHVRNIRLYSLYF